MTSDLNALDRGELLMLATRCIPAPTDRQVAEARVLAAEAEWWRLQHVTSLMRAARKHTREGAEANPRCLTHREAFEESDIDVRRAELAAGRAWTRLQELTIALEALEQAEAA